VGFLSEHDTIAPAPDALVGRNWRHGSWAAAAVGIAIVGLLGLFWLPPHGLIGNTTNEAVDLSIETRVGQVETSVIVARAVGQLTAYKSATVPHVPATVPDVPSLALATMDIADTLPAHDQKRKGTGSNSAVLRTMRIPAGTLVPISLETPVRSIAGPGAPVRARVRSDVVVNKRVVIPHGSILRGHVTNVQRPQSRWISALKVWEFAETRRVVFRFTTLQVPGSTKQPYSIRTEPVAGQAKSARHRVAIPAALATAGGAILAGPLGAAGGGIVARAIAGSTNNDTRVPRGTAMSARILNAAQKQ
jgi:hypothetical protein